MTLALIVWLVMTLIPLAKGILSTVLAVMTVTFVIGAFCVIEAESFAPLRTLTSFWKNILKWFAPLLVVFALLPNEKTAWYMVGAYAAESAVTSEVAGELGGAAKDMLLELMNKAKAEIGEVDSSKVAEVVKGVAEEAVKEGK